MFIYRYKTGCRTTIWTSFTYFFKMTIYLTYISFSAFFLAICFISGLAFLCRVRVHYELSESMAPLIRRGDMVFVHKEMSYGVGDIIVYYTGQPDQESKSGQESRLDQESGSDRVNRSSQEMGEGREMLRKQDEPEGQIVCITHRIVRVGEEGYRTRGDANDSPDRYPVRPDQVEGRVIGVIPYYGQACLIIKDHGIFLLLFMISGAGIICYRRT